MKKQRLFKLATVALLVVGTLAAASCKKDEVTTGGESTTSKVVKGITQATIPALKVKVVSNGDTTLCPLSDLLDITIEVVAGENKQTKQYKGEELTMEATTSTIPSTGTFKVTATPKSSFVPDSTKGYIITLNAISTFLKVYSNGEQKNFGTESLTLNSSYTRKPLTTERLATLAQRIERDFTNTGEFTN